MRYAAHARAATEINGQQMAYNRACDHRHRTKLVARLCARRVQASIVKDLAGRWETFTVRRNVRDAEDV